MVREQPGHRERPAVARLQAQRKKGETVCNNCFVLFGFFRNKPIANRQALNGRQCVPYSESRHRSVLGQGGATGVRYRHNGSLTLFVSKQFTPAASRSCQQWAEYGERES